MILMKVDCTFQFQSSISYDILWLELSIADFMYLVSIIKTYVCYPIW